MLTERQLLILQIIIDDFIRSAQPVGSRTLSKREEIPFSSATIRNEMADLEDLGYIEKTHTSSGRVPSEKGYRYYVDHLLKPIQPTVQDVNVLRTIFEQQLFEIEKVAKHSVNILSEMTNYTSILLGPKMDKHRLKSVQLIPLSPHSAVSIIVTDVGVVQNKVITLSPTTDIYDIEKMVKILNDRLAGVPLSQLKARLNQEVSAVLRQHVTDYDSLLNTVKGMMDVSSKENLYTSGNINLLAQPEFKDVNKVRNFLATLEKQDELKRLLTGGKKGINILIGSETGQSGMEDCSIITATYSTGGNGLGTIAVVGPTRMDYSRVVSLLTYVTNELSLSFNDRYLIDEEKE
ncbi:MAG: heat-inducible transcriptional repressor HrcA [Bacillaceae bacterium]